MWEDAGPACVCVWLHDVACGGILQFLNIQQSKSFTQDETGTSLKRKDFAVAD